MYWKFKAIIQNFVSYLPSSLSYALYYWLQRRFGGLEKINTLNKLADGVETWTKIMDLGIDPKGKVFFEIGTGRVPFASLAYWLMGAKKIITIDVNPYLQADLIKESLQYISNNEMQVRKLFGAFLEDKNLNDLLRFIRLSSFSTTAFLDMCQIVYVAPGDAANTALPANSVDFHTSYMVLEHIPNDILEKIFIEGNRIIRDHGLFVHRIDYSDHFAYSDKSISSGNFLQYSDVKWERYAGNRYMYMNRLRHDDYISMLVAKGHQILKEEPLVDEQVQNMIKDKKLSLAERFKSKSYKVLATTGAWILSQPKQID